MRARTAVVAIVLCTALQAEVAHAQFSPHGIINMATRPLRQMLGRLGHAYGPHYRKVPRRLSRSLAASPAAAGAAAAATNPALPPSGPSGWPNAFETVLGYALWPDDYAAQFRGRGFDVIATGLIGPARGRPGARTARADAAMKSDAGDDAADICGVRQDDKEPWPIPQLAQAGDLSPAQRAALDKLKDAVAGAQKTLLADCRAAAPSNALDGLGATIRKLWAVRDAAVFVRDPLKDFYAALDDGQKAKFIRESEQPADASGSSDNNRSAASKAADSAMARQYRMCAAPSLEAAERMVRQIAAEVRPRKEQSTSLEALRKTSADMAKLVTAGCAQPIPQDPVARLDAANDQLATMSYAASSLNVALNGFYAQLDSKQKAKFEALNK